MDVGEKFFIGFLVYILFVKIAPLSQFCEDIICFKFLVVIVVQVMSHLYLAVCSLKSIFFLWSSLQAIQLILEEHYIAYHFHLAGFYNCDHTQPTLKQIK